MWRSLGNGGRLRNIIVVPSKEPRLSGRGSYDHVFAPKERIGRQPCQTKGGIVVGDDAWLSFGVIVLSYVRIGKGAVMELARLLRMTYPMMSLQLAYRHE